jgi:hypothetical protein
MNIIHSIRGVEMRKYKSKSMPKFAGYSGKTSSLVYLLSKNTQKSKILSPLYFCGIIHKNLSKKESFYQSLFIQELGSNNSIRIPDKFEGINNVLNNNNCNSNLNEISLILENLFVLPASLVAGHFNSDRSRSVFSDNNKKNGQRLRLYPLFFQDKIFITYKKSFLCYWLLPFLGLVGGYNSTLFKPSILFPLTSNNDPFSSEISPIKNNRINQTLINSRAPSYVPSCLISPGHEHTNTSTNKVISNKLLNNDNQRTEENNNKEYSLLLSTQRKNTDFYIKENSIFSNFGTKNTCRQQSILLNILNFYKNRISTLPSLTGILSGRSTLDEIFYQPASLSGCTPSLSLHPAQPDAKHLAHTLDAKHPASLPVCKPSQGVAGIRDWKLDMTMSCRQGEGKNFVNIKGSGFYFSNIQDVLRDYELKKIELHANIWLKWDGFIENGSDQEEPIEIRLDSLGNWKEIYNKSQKSYNSKNSHNDFVISAQYILTTPGKIIFNQIIHKVSK